MNGQSQETCTGPDTIKGQPAATGVGHGNEGGACECGQRCRGKGHRLEFSQPMKQGDSNGCTDGANSGRERIATDGHDGDRKVQVGKGAQRRPLVHRAMGFFIRGGSGGVQGAAPASVVQLESAVLLTLLTTMRLQCSGV